MCTTQISVKPHRLTSGRLPRVRVQVQSAVTAFPAAASLPLPLPLCLTVRSQLQVAGGSTVFFTKAIVSSLLEK